IDQRLNGIDQRFDGIDQRLNGIDRRLDGVDTRLEDVKTELLVRIEAVDAKVGLVIEKVDDLIRRDLASLVAHARVDERLDDHELRLTALEQGRARAKSDES
ncbi:MAG: hypothetical protein ACRELT_01095, partial [Longimicrobiales bacterium]